MGTWGEKNFESDSALDFLEIFAKATKTSSHLNLLLKISFRMMII